MQDNVGTFSILWRFDSFLMFKPELIKLLLIFPHKFFTPVESIDLQGFVHKSVLNSS